MGSEVFLDIQHDIEISIKSDKFVDPEHENVDLEHEMGIHNTEINTCKRIHTPQATTYARTVLNCTKEILHIQRVFHILPQIYTANLATFPIQMYAITVKIFGNF